VKTVDDVGAASLRELGRMTRGQVEALTDDARAARRERLLADPTPWGINRIADEFGMKSRDAVAKWRGNYLRTGQVGANALPAPANEDECLKPGDTAASAASPVWPAGAIRAWGVQCGRMDEDFVPRPGGRRPPGRTPRTAVDDDPVPAAA
jgi:hypothetical protein